MYMMAAGDGRMLVGDPSLGNPLLSADSLALATMEGGPDFSADTQRRFDAVAKLAAGTGYQVFRIPTVPGRDGKQYLTYVNVIMDVRDGQPIVYMPTYQNQPRLNAAARSVWESLGYQVLPVDCTSLWEQGGTLHCLVNVLERKALP
jgi:agmatine/peptidylarginine deiminase